MYNFSIDNPNYDVYVNLISSPAGKYLSRRPYLISLVKELVSTTKLKGEQIVIEKDIGREIGTTDIVSTTSEDNIYYALPLKSDVYSRFAKNRYPQKSSSLTIIIMRDSEGNYEVEDTWIGTNHPAFPGGKMATTASKKFWQTHALVQDAQLIQSKSITKDCPY